MYKFNVLWVTLLMLGCILVSYCKHKDCDTLCQYFTLLEKESPEQIIAKFRNTPLDTILIHDLDNNQEYESIFSVTANNIGNNNANLMVELQQYLKAKGVTDFGRPLRLAIIEAFYLSLHGKKYSIEACFEEMKDYQRKYYKKTYK